MTARKVRYQVTGRDKDKNIISQNIRYTEKGAKDLAKKMRKRKNVRSAKIVKIK